MAESAVQKNLVESNEKYVASFKDGDLALPPAKKYVVGQSLSTPSADPSNALFL